MGLFSKDKSKTIVPTKEEIEINNCQKALDSYAYILNTIPDKPLRCYVEEQNEIFIQKRYLFWFDADYVYFLPDVTDDYSKYNINIKLREQTSDDYCKFIYSLNINKYAKSDSYIKV